MSKKQKPWWEQYAGIAYHISIETLKHPLKEFLKELEEKDALYNEKTKKYDGFYWIIHKDKNKNPNVIIIIQVDDDDFIDLGNTSLKELMLKYTDKFINIDLIQ